MAAIRAITLISGLRQNAKVIGLGRRRTIAGRSGAQRQTNQGRRGFRLVAGTARRRIIVATIEDGLRCAAFGWPQGGEFDVREDLRRAAGMGQARLCRPGQVPRHVCALGQRSQRLLGRAGQAGRLDQALHQGREHLVRARQHLDQMVRGRRAQRRLELHRPASRQARRPDRDHLGGRQPLRVEAHHLSAAARRSLQVRQHPAHPQRQEGRPRHHLSADDSGSRLRDAGLRADRRDPFGGVRRLLARQPRPAHHRLPIQDRHHRRRRPARRQEGAAEGQCRCRDRQERRRRLGRRGQAHRRAGRHGSGARFLVPRRRRDGDDGMPGRSR